MCSTELITSLLGQDSTGSVGKYMELPWLYTNTSKVIFSWIWLSYPMQAPMGLMLLSICRLWGDRVDIWYSWNARKLVVEFFPPGIQRFEIKGSPWPKTKDLNSQMWLMWQNKDVWLCFFFFFVSCFKWWHNSCLKKCLTDTITFILCIKFDCQLCKSDRC